MKDFRYLTVHLDELRALIAKSGKSLQYIAKELGIAEMTLYNKMHGKTDFTCYEAAMLRKLLNINEYAVFCRVFGFYDL